MFRSILRLRLPLNAFAPISGDAINAEPHSFATLDKSPSDNHWVAQSNHDANLIGDVNTDDTLSTFDGLLLCSVVTSFMLNPVSRNGSVALFKMLKTGASNADCISETNHLSETIGTCLALSGTRLMPDEATPRRDEMSRPVDGWIPPLAISAIALLKFSLFNCV